MNNNQPKFKVGDLAVLKADLSRKGPVIEILSPLQGQCRYRVFHSPDDIREYLEEQISLSSISTDHIMNGRGLKPEEFVARLNSLRLNYPQVDSLYALHAARINYIPFQFKPLLRFLRSDQPRLLIADDVGVGKTIEAGLILRELQSRQELRNILILCPKALVLKWRVEMKRFDEDFRPLTTETLRYCLRETNQDGIWPNQYTRSIVHLELLRREEYLMGTQEKRSRPGLLTLNPPPQFDLLIVDEAHHLRTPDTRTNELARFLCSVSEAAIFLTATPMQLGSKNLFTLLNLLQPDQFIDETLFQEMVAPNKYLNQAIRHIRTKRPIDTWQNDACSGLDNAAKTPWGQSVIIHDSRFSGWLTRLKENNELIDEERIKFIRDMEDIHTLAHIMNRTRRRDIGRFTIREPFTISVPFTKEQQHLYESLVSYRKEMLALFYDPHLIKLITDMLERQAASCLPALLPALDSFIQTGRFTLTAMTDDPELDDNDLELPQDLIEKAGELKRIAASLPDEDPKSDRLIRIVSETINSEGPGKVLVFSFFLHTLSYLEKNLRQKGYRVAVINGQIDDEVREELRERFRLNREDNNAIDVLLSSEVGCEGLDYEFCSRLVNYDIPWNPMRIEQRIGRIDRFGQKSEKIQIYNFITPGTIEERIFFRCFERLGIFKDTVGDMEEVLGEITQALTQAALDPSLTPRQAEEKAQQLADNALRLIEEQRRLEEESTELLGLDRTFQDEVEKIEKEGRFVSPEELQQIISLYLGVRCQNAKMSTDSKQNKLIRLRANREDRDVLLEDLRKIKRQDRQTVEFKRWLEGNDPYLTVTFDQETALDQRDIPFITPVHPLTKIALFYWNSLEGPLFTQIEVEDYKIQPGVYAFSHYLWESISLQSEIRLVSLAWDLKEWKLSNTVSERLPMLLKPASPITSPLSLPREQLEQALHSLEESIHEKRLKEIERLKVINHQLVEQRLASLNRYYQRRLERTSEELHSATDDRICRMKESEQSRIQREWNRKKQEIEERKKTDIISQRVAFGIMEVKSSGK